MFASTSAMPHIPIPPIPTKWILVSGLRNMASGERLDTTSLVRRARPGHAVAAQLLGRDPVAALEGVAVHDVVLVALDVPRQVHRVDRVVRTIDLVEARGTDRTQPGAIGAVAEDEARHAGRDDELEPRVVLGELLHEVFGDR